MSEDKVTHNLWAIESALETIYDHLYNNKPVTKNCIVGRIKMALAELDLASDALNINRVMNFSLRGKLAQFDTEQYKINKTFLTKQTAR